MKDKLKELWLELWPFILVLTIFCLAILLGSCKSTAKIEVVHDTIYNSNTEYVNKYIHDSIVSYDSIYIREKGDTVFVDKVKYRYIMNEVVDTMIVTDTVFRYTEVPVEVVKEKKVVPSWCWILLAINTLVAGYIGCWYYFKKHGFE